MKNIHIPVPPNIAVAFENASDSDKIKAETYINAWLSSFFSDQPANERLFDIMKKARAEAKSKGFTTDKLNDLLRDE